MLYPTKSYFTLDMLRFGSLIIKREKKKKKYYESPELIRIKS